MDQFTITAEQMEKFHTSLIEEEKASGTIENYLRHVRALQNWLGTRELEKKGMVEWRDELKTKYQPRTVNAMIASVNHFFSFIGREDCRLKPLRIQREIFREDSRELTEEEYNRLVATAKEKGNDRMAMILETLAATGIRVSELQYITVEAVNKGKVEISLKNKIRVILLPDDLRRKLKEYIKEREIRSGEIIITKSGRGVSRNQIWAEMKELCEDARVLRSKVFPHNLRHLFARVHYQKFHDLVTLSDMLGHSSIEITRIYLISTGKEHARQLNELGLVS